ncbi:DUF2591 domain-containing protein [Salmonella enterica]|nr:DUF2591 domain-containing protein [Salmonella enterica]
MKNYEDMSDSQIAQKVFFFVSSNHCPNGGLAHISSDGFFFFDDKNIKRKFDPCNTPSDAWPIIVDNEISINRWALSDGCGADRFGHFDTRDDKPLRAAMIVFLKMNEDKL